MFIIIFKKIFIFVWKGLFENEEKNVIKMCSNIKLEYYKYYLNNKNMI